MDWSELFANHAGGIKKNTNLGSPRTAPVLEPAGAIRGAAMKGHVVGSKNPCHVSSKRALPGKPIHTQGLGELLGRITEGI